MSNIYSNDAYNNERKRPVSTSAVVRIVIWSLVFCLLTGVFALAMVWNGLGGGFGGINIGGYWYDEANYRVGNGSTRETINEISIEWVAGRVTVIQGEGDEIVISETYDGDDDDQMLRWKVEEGELTIKYSKPVLFGSVSSARKDLTVEIPSSMALGLDEVHISAVSATQSISVPARELDIETVSGNVDMKGSFGTVDIETVSGNLAFEGSVKDLSIDCVSARAEVRLTEQADSVEVDTVSGDVTLILPESTTGFRVHTDALSDRVDIRGFDVGSDRKWGDGRMEIQIDAASAKLIVEKETND